MDELLIGEKKYVSSKLAAKMTGYAKDYVGQLCREGRVPARLVGRSWYVLESAIQDHRFGNLTQKVEEHTGSNNSPMTETWESPRYEASRVETLPSINRLKDNTQTAAISVDNDDDTPPQNLEDSWKAWFDRVADVSTSSTSHENQEEIKEPENIVGGIEEEVAIPIHTVYNFPPEDLLPQQEILPVKLEQERGHTRRKGGKVIMTVGTVLAMLIAILAVVGSGYFDEYIISNKQVSQIAGVALYNR